MSTVSFQSRIEEQLDRINKKIDCEPERTASDLVVDGSTVTVPYGWYDEAVTATAEDPGFYKITVTNNRTGDTAQKKSVIFKGTDLSINNGYVTATNLTIAGGATKEIHIPKPVSGATQVEIVVLSNVVGNPLVITSDYCTLIANVVLEGSTSRWTLFYVSGLAPNEFTLTIS